MSLLELEDRIKDAAARRTALRLRGGGTKDFYGNPARGEMLDTRAHAGIVSYEPTELVLTARCGTKLAEVEAALAARGQMLPFEPPHFGTEATFGGCIAAGLAGPRRAAAGAVRDFVLGAKMIDGRGRVLSFGGQVMKNVAGYDVSRVLAGSLGTLGLIAEASVKVLPRPGAETTRELDATLEEAISLFGRWAAQPLPVSATAWHDGRLFVRLSGSEAALRSAIPRIGGSETASSAPWLGIREHTHPFFAGEDPLWRIALPPLTAPLGLPGRTLVEWNGGLRWLKSEAPAALVREAAQRAGGHATLFRAADMSAGAFAPLDPVNLRLQRELKAAFDPAGILNPGRMALEL